MAQEEKTKEDKSSKKIKEEEKVEEETKSESEAVGGEVSETSEEENSEETQDEENKDEKQEDEVEVEKEVDDNEEKVGEEDISENEKSSENEDGVEDETSEAEEEVVEENISEEIEGVEEVKDEEERIPDFGVGDTIRVSYKIIEGDKIRTQPFQGIVISKKGSDVSKTFTVRKIGADGVGVERIFPLHSPNIEKIKVVKRGKVRRAKLYYLRDRIGRKATRIKEKIQKEK
jgi:large subunit ribosomal protein L19